MPDIDYMKIPLMQQSSPPDSRDYIITRLIPKLNVFPDEFEIPYNHDVKNQGQINSCEAHSASYVMESGEEKRFSKYIQMSPGCVYGNREQGDYQGSGMTPRQAWKEILDRGICSWDVFPINEEIPKIYDLVNQNKDKISTDAQNHKIKAYAQVYTDDEIRSALMQLGMVNASIKIAPSFYQITKANPVMPYYQHNEPLLGYHAVTLVGFTKKFGKPCYKVLNSWGKDWGENGYFYIPFDLAMVEAWSVTILEAPQPSPDPVTHKFWRVQVGSFLLKTNAQNKADEMKTLGYNSYIVKVGLFYKVQLSAFSIEVNARNFSALLKSKNIDNFVVFY